MSDNDQSPPSEMYQRVGTLETDMATLTQAVTELSRATGVLTKKFDSYSRAPYATMITFASAVVFALVGYVNLAITPLELRIEHAKELTQQKFDMYDPRLTTLESYHRDTWRDTHGAPNHDNVRPPNP